MPKGQEGRGIIDACLQALGPRADRLRMLADFIVERLH